jgi:hypothetical protein
MGRRRVMTWVPPPAGFARLAYSDGLGHHRDGCRLGPGRVILDGLAAAPMPTNQPAFGLAQAPILRTVPTPLASTTLTCWAEIRVKSERLKDQRREGCALRTYPISRRLGNIAPPR